MIDDQIKVEKMAFFSKFSFDVCKAYLQKRYPISELGIFGSYARGDFNEKSDIDILVDFDGRIDGFQYIHLAHELEDTFNQKVKFKR